MTRIIKIAHTSDNHIGPDRWEENRNSLMWMAHDINDQNCHLTTIAGDFYDRKATENDVWLASTFISALNTDVFIQKGNHGTDRGLELMRNWYSGQGEIRISMAPEIVTRSGVTIYSMPHLDKAGIQKAMNIVGVIDSQIAFNEAVDKIFEYFIADSQQRKGPKIFLGHFTVSGSKVSTGQELYDPGLQQGFMVRVSTLEKLNVLLASIGHIHLSQMLKTTPFPIFYNGGHSRFNFGETEQKGYYISTIDAESNVLIDLEYRINPHAPLLVTERYRFDGTDWQLESEPADFQGAEVRIVAAYQEGMRPNFKDLEEFYEGNCVRWKLEKQLITASKTRHVEIAQATTPQEQLELYWKHQPDTAPIPEDRPTIMALLTDSLRRIANEV